MGIPKEGTARRKVYDHFVTLAKNNKGEMLTLPHYDGIAKELGLNNGQVVAQAFSTFLKDGLVERGRRCLREYRLSPETSTETQALEEKVEPTVNEATKTEPVSGPSPSTSNGSRERKPKIQLVQALEALAPLPPDEEWDEKYKKPDPCGHYPVGVVVRNLQRKNPNIPQEEILTTLDYYVKRSKITRVRILRNEFLFDPNKMHALRMGSEGALEKLLFVLAQLPKDGSQLVTNNNELAALSRGKYKFTDFLKPVNDAAKAGVIRRYKSTPLTIAWGDNPFVAIYPTKEYFNGQLIDVRERLVGVEPAPPIPPQIVVASAQEALQYMTKALEDEKRQHGEKANERQAVLEKLAGIKSDLVKYLGNSESANKILNMVEVEVPNLHISTEEIALLEQSLPTWQKVLCRD